ncbi:hypothetical protein G7067_13580 [Leucobacter insecticola]|uniref:DUF2975 domain-containing protein n=1 Tax=Leucobacter insecticola TaxID=2714934 RepID=A0A6G8FL45_9MICO|nr:hypothetical protein [Leucobacter insecticola]QIM17210.1 hypothetical protein G7067_13580 [Leucobacter insecticola]
MPHALPHRTSPGDRFAMFAFMLLSAVVVAVSAAQMIARISVVQGRTNVPMLVTFAGEHPVLRLTTNDSIPPLKLESATMIVPQLSDGAATAATLQAAVAFGTAAVVVVCLTLLSPGFLRGRVFSRRNTALLATAGLTGLVGTGLAASFGGTASMEAFDSLSSGEGVALFAVEPGPFIIGTFAFALIMTAFSVGARLQRETEGLV